MFSQSCSFSGVIRAVLTIVATASLSVTIHPAIAQPAAKGLAGVQSSLPQKPVLINQAILDRLGIQRPELTNVTELSQQIARQFRANGLPAGAGAPQRPDARWPPPKFRVKSALSIAIMTTLNSGN